MPGITIGDLAPSFRLPSAQGPEIGSEDYRGQKKLVVWFTKGMACAFCRSHMSQIARGYPEFQRLSAEVLEVSSTKPERARFYGQNFPLPFPYLCDPDYEVRRAWTRDGVRSHSPFWYANAFMKMMKAEPPKEEPMFGNEVKVKPSEIPKIMKDDDMGFFILDRQGVVRYSLVDSYADYEHGKVRPIPSNDEILRELSRCD